jgi:hypothetical protein
MNWITIMNSLVKQDMLDLAKVNVPSWGIVIWMQNSIQDINGFVQETGISIVIILVVLYNLFKVVKMFHHMMMTKDERYEESKEN